MKCLHNKQRFFDPPRTRRNTKVFLFFFVTFVTFVDQSSLGFGLSELGKSGNQCARYRSISPNSIVLSASGWMRPPNVSISRLIAALSGVNAALMRAIFSRRPTSSS